MYTIKDLLKVLISSVISIRPLLLYLLVAPVAFSRDIAQKEKDASPPRFECPIYDIVFWGHNLDEFKDIGSWEECGTHLFYV